MSQTILAFDMGIRNLAFCLVDVSGREFVIKAWDNYDLLAGTDSQAASRCGCGGPPSWSDESIWCKKCVKSGKASKKALPEGTTLTITSLKELALSEGWALGKKVKKEEYLNELKKRYLIPYVKPKGTMKTNLLIILDAMEIFITNYIDKFCLASSIRIENQPALNAPTMKSVQMILFTLLVHRLRKEKGWTGSVSFVHASKKTEEAQEQVDNAGGNYSARKNTAEALVIKKLSEGPWKTFFLGRKKRSDLADAFLMCLL